MSDDYAGPGVPTFGPPIRCHTPHYHVPSIKGLPGSECLVCGKGPLSGIHTLTEQEKAELAYPYHHPTTALANYRAGREVWDTNGDLR